mgnify:CR=1 FL=1
MTRNKAEASGRKPGAGSKGRGQKSREYDAGALDVTATTDVDWPEAQERLMEEIISRGNLKKAYNRVMSNKGAAGVDGMTTGRLKEHLIREWPRIREELLGGRYIWRQWKRPATRVRKLMQRALSEERARKSAGNGRGPWWNSGAPHMNEAFDRSYFTKLGLFSLLSQFHRCEFST